MARSCTIRLARSSSHRRYWHERRRDRRGIRLHPRHLCGFRGRLESALDPPHAADERRQCDPRDRHRRRDARRERNPRTTQHHPRISRGRARHCERRRRFRRDRSHARHVQATTDPEDRMTVATLIPVAYLIAAITFILGLKGLSSPTTAVQGNRIAAAGMLIAVIATFFSQDVNGGLPVILAGILVGGAAGFYGARVVKMTAMPQMVALFNGAGGGAAALVAILEFARELATGRPPDLGVSVTTLLALIIGAVSFSGSAVAFGKLQGLITPKAFRYAGQQLVTGGIAAATALLSLVLLAGTIGGSFAVEPIVLIAVITLLALVFAVAPAQPGVRQLADLLESRGINVKYAIHPVAGRMPGHMNVLLAEANVPYDKLFDMDQINPEFQRADVARVIGANDVTNPAARSNPGSPIYGMPILDVDKAQNIIVIKRSMKPGFAGIDNDLYLDPKTAMLFGDAKDAVGKVVQELKKAA